MYALTDGNGNMKKTLIPMIMIMLVLGVILILGSYFFVLKNKNLIPAREDLSQCDQKDMPYLNSHLPVEERVDDLLNRMTDWEKIGQMALIEKNSIDTTSDITRYNLGAILSGGGAGPWIDTPGAWVSMINKFQSAAAETCYKIPLLYGIDAVHGNGGVLGSTVFPHAIGLGASHDADLVKRVASAVADEMAAVGIYWSYSPNIDVVQDIRWGKTYETFGSDVDNVTKLGLAFLQGTQDTSKGYINVVATPKHFVGGGSMAYGTARNAQYKIEEGNIPLDEKKLREVHLTPFKAAVAGGAQVVMVGTATWNEKMNTSNHYLLTEVLKGELGFSGFIVSDWYAVYQVADTRYHSLVKSINAGIDMVMTPFEYKDFMSNMQQAITSGDITNKRLDDAARRILTVKFKAGLFDRPQPTPEGLSVLRSDQHRALAREAVRKSQVLLKNNDATVPLSPSLSRIIVAGSSADNVGRQAGGWTTEWQGIDGNKGVVGTSILEALRNTVSDTTEVIYNQQGNFSSTHTLADIGIVVVGEKPYAEGVGDHDNPSLSDEDLLVIAKTKAKSKKVVVIIVSGRPLDLSLEAKSWDSIIAAWLPGSEAEGITDVLFGLYPFTGSLPVEWKY